jgi:hypothetical protein
VGKTCKPVEEYYYARSSQVTVTVGVELKGTIVRVDPPDGSKIEVGKSVPIRVDARNDSSVTVEAYPLVVVRGVKTGAEYARLTASAVQMNPGEVKSFTATEAFKMPSEDVEVIIVLHMRQILSYQWYSLTGSLRYCPREVPAGALCRGAQTATSLGSSRSSERSGR